MKPLLKSLLTNNLLLKVASLIFGIGLWIILGASHTNTLYVDVPLCFYGGQNKEVEAPEFITVELAGKRSDLYCLDFDNLAVHLNLDEFTVGSHVIEITAEQLFLPSSVKVIHCSPSNPVIKIHDKDATIAA